MSLFSLTSLRTSAVATLRRFPLPLLSALVATVSMIYVIHIEPRGNELPLASRLAMTGYLSMLLTISVSLFTERFVPTNRKKRLIWLAAILLIAVYFFALPSVANGVTGIRFALLAVALHLLVAFAPFVLPREMNGLWQYNKSLFIRILIGGVYSGVLYAGLALAILAVDNLFEVRINEKFYAQLWFIIAGVFNTWFFLSGVPQNLSALEGTTDYPKGLKIFTVYVLIPLITVYLVILYAYAGKILITSNWPVGWVANLVIAFAIFGILSFLLVYPLRDDKSNAWVKFYSRLFYYLLVPLIALLYVSIFKRIDMYGVTVERYLVVLLAVWLSFVAAYFILTSGKRIWIIPLSLCVAITISTFGPWGAFAISHCSQIGELTALLESDRVIVNGKVDTTSTHDVKSEDYERIGSIVRYINDIHGHERLQLFFDQSIDSVIARKNAEDDNVYNSNSAVLEMLRIQRVDTGEGEVVFLTYGINYHVMLNTDGYDLVTAISRVDFYKSGDSTSEYLVGADTVQIVYSPAIESIELRYRDYEALVLDLKSLYASLPNDADSELPHHRLTLLDEHPKWRAKLVFSSLEISREKNTTGLVAAEGILMLSFNQETTRAARRLSE